MQWRRKQAQPTADPFQVRIQNALEFPPPPRMEALDTQLRHRLFPEHRDRIAPMNHSRLQMEILEILGSLPPMDK